MAFSGLGGFIGVEPRFFLTGGSGLGYQTFVIQAIQWGNAQGLRITLLLSPYPWPTRPSCATVTFAQFTGNTFGQDTRTSVKRLIAKGAVPTQWAVDTYGDTHPDDTPAMTPETKANTSMGVAPWLAGTDPAAAGSGGPGPLACL